MRRIRLILIFVTFIFSNQIYASSFCWGICKSISIDTGGHPVTANVDAEISNDTISFKGEIVTISRSGQIDPKPFGTKNTPERLLIFDDQNTLLGGATRINPDNSFPKIYATARHVLAGKTKVHGEIDDQNINLSHYKLVQVQSNENGSWLDVVFIVESVDSWNLANTDENDPYVQSVVEAIRLYSITPESTSQSSNWYTWNYGNFDGQPISGLSMGILTGVDRSSPYFWTGESELNSTSPGSSGSIVWQSSRQNDVVYPVGVVQCMQLPGSDEKNITLITPRPRVLSLKYLLNNNLIWNLKNINDLLSGPSQPEELNCPHINGRGGGAD